jgi:hypothetical protein
LSNGWFLGLDSLTALPADIPNHGEHLVRYCGWYSNVIRGKRKKAENEAGGAGTQELVEGPASASGRALKQQWARLIKQVYEVDSLVCPRCSGTMRIIAFIEQPEVIERILTHLGLWPAPAHGAPGYSLSA